MAAGDANQPCLGYITTASVHDAQNLSYRLLEAGVIACANILPTMTSIYRFDGKMESATEVVLLIKTTAARYADLEAAIRAAHPYELPEIIAVPIIYGLPEYLGWVATETRTAPADGNLPA